MVNVKLEEGYTEFGAPLRGWFLPSGYHGKFFANFFGDKTKEILAKGQPNLPDHPLAGDTVLHREISKAGGPSAGYAFGFSQVLPRFAQYEIDRKTRYREFELMDTYPEISTAFDIYADDCTQINIDGERWEIKTKHPELKEETLFLFKEIHLDRFIWDIVRNTVKFGDCFTENVVDLNAPSDGIQRIKILDPNFIYRIENEFGYVTDYLQELPDDMDGDTFGASYEWKGQKFVPLNKNQIVHFRLHTSNANFSPYGKSIASSARSTYRAMKMMEEAMIIYRIERAPERLIFYIDVGNVPTAKATAFVEEMKERYRKERFYHASLGNVDSRHNPLSVNENLFIAHRGGVGTKVDVLPGAQNLGEVDDVKYFRDKLLACLKIPKDYIVEKDKSPERKANLSQLDVKFARTIVRVQSSIEIGLESIAKRHLILKGYPIQWVKNLHVKLPSPSDLFIKRQMDVAEQKAAVISAEMSLGLFDKKYFYMTYYNMNEQEIAEMQARVQQEQATNPMMQQRGGMMPLGNPNGGLVPMDQVNAPANYQNGFDSRENIPPTQQEEKMKGLQLLKAKLLAEEKDVKVLDRILARKESFKNKNRITEDK